MSTDFIIGATDRGAIVAKAPKLFRRTLAGEADGQKPHDGDSGFILVVLRPLHRPFDEFRKHRIPGDSLRGQANRWRFLGIAAQQIALIDAFTKAVAERLRLDIGAAFAQFNHRFGCHARGGYVLRQRGRNR